MENSTLSDSDDANEYNNYSNLQENNKYQTNNNSINKNDN